VLQTLDDLAANSGTSLQQPGQASCTGVPTDKYVSAINSRRASASLTTTVGPVATIQPSFRWANRTTWTARPARTPAPARPARHRGDCAIAGKREVGKYLVYNHCQSVLGGQLGKTIEIIVGYKRTSGVVGTDQNDGGGVGEIQAGKSMCQCPSKRSR